MSKGMLAVAMFASMLWGCGGGGGGSGDEMSPETRFVDNGNGTITDHQTGLMWEKKSDDGSIHDWDNEYSWCIGSGLCTNRNDPPDGTAFTAFLASLNTPPCFAGHCDWRLPTSAGNTIYGITYQSPELESILADPCAGSSGPCVPPIFSTNCAPGCKVTGCSCTQPDFYWSASTHVADTFPGNPPDTSDAWYASFYDGYGSPYGGIVSFDFKTKYYHVRAVRVGL